MCCLVAKFLCLPIEPRLYNYKFRSTSSFFLILMRTTGGWSLRMWHIMRSRIESRELTTTQVRKSMEWKSRHFSNERKMSCDKGKERQVFPSKCSWAVTCKIEFTFEVFWVLSKVPEKKCQNFYFRFRGLKSPISLYDQLCSKGSHKAYGSLFCKKVSFNLPRERTGEDGRAFDLLRLQYRINFVSDLQ